MSRYYEPIWEKLKSLPHPIARTEGISITAPVFLHARIIKAVIKEKYNDIGYKISLHEMHGKKSRLWYKRKSSIITFYLSFNFSLEDFTEDDIELRAAKHNFNWKD